MVGRLLRIFDDPWIAHHRDVTRNLHPYRLLEVLWLPASPTKGMAHKLTDHIPAQPLHQTTVPTNPTEGLRQNSW